MQIHNQGQILQFRARNGNDNKNLSLSLCTVLYMQREIYSKGNFTGDFRLQVFFAMNQLTLDP
jgi:hypothetical protein